MKYGFLNTKFCEAIPSVYDEVYKFYRGLSPVKLDGRWGMVDKRGNIALKFMYDDKWVIPKVGENNLILAHHEGGFHFLTTDGILLKAFIYQNVFPFDGNSAVIIDNDKYGLIGQDFEVLLPPTYESIQSCSEGLRPFEEGGLFGYLDEAGKVVIPPRFKIPGPHLGGVAPVDIDGPDGDELCGYVDRKGEYIIPPIFTGGRAFWTDLAMVEQDGRVGFIDRSGKYIVPNEYDDIRNFYGDFAAVNRGGASEFKRLREAISRCNKSLDEMHELHKKLIVKLEQEIQKNRKETELSPEEQIVEESNLSLARKSKITFSNSKLSKATENSRDGRWGHINRKNEIIVPIEYSKVGDFSEGMAFVCDGEAFGYFDSQGKFKIPAVFEDAGNFKNDRARVKIDGCWGFINQAGKWIAKPVYQDANDFGNGLALVQLDGKWGMIDQEGKEVLPPKYDYLENYSEGMAEMGYN